MVYTQKQQHKFGLLKYMTIQPFDWALDLYSTMFLSSLTNVSRIQVFHKNKK